MKKNRRLLALLLLIISPLQVIAAIDNSLGFVFQAGNNIPVSYTGTATTTALGEIVLQVSHTLGAGGAGCGAVDHWTTADPSAGPGFPVSPGSYTIYLNTSTDWNSNRSIANALCPGGTTNRYMKVASVSNQDPDFTPCTVNANNCFTMNCSATGVVAGGLTGALPTVSCP